MHVDNDPDFHEFMFGWDWCGPERELALDPWHFAADEPTLAAQGDYQADVSPLAFGRVLSEAEDYEAAAPLVLMPGPNALDPARTFPKPTRIAIRGHWRRREGFNEAWGRLVRSSTRSEPSLACIASASRSAPCSMTTFLWTRGKAVPIRICARSCSRRRTAAQRRWL
jgi:hypothetical protein